MQLHILQGFSWWIFVCKFSSIFSGHFTQRIIQKLRHKPLLKVILLFFSEKKIFIFVASSPWGNWINYEDNLLVLVNNRKGLWEKKIFNWIEGILYVRNWFLDLFIYTFRITFKEKPPQLKIYKFIIFFKCM